mmetsp:Transcript_25823/g.43306  ORF Transcript_25823/g.43306 Transcript_25823/m.43306 type:complete len:347 (-) Transcript_25823:132-1172(-)
MLSSRTAIGARPLASVADNSRELVSTPSASKALATTRESSKLGARHVARARNVNPVNIVSTKLFADDEVMARAERAWEAVEEYEPIEGTLDEGAYCEGYFAPSDEEVNNLMEGELLKGDVLYSTTYHRTIVASAALAALGLVVEGVSTTSAPSVALAVVLGYVFSDLGSGVFHWSVDNYGSEKTPAFGGVIAAFQGHHLYPWTITTREFCNNIHKVATPAIPIQALWLMAPLPGSVDVFLAVFSTMVILSQQFHSWAHTRKSQLPAPVIALQDAGVLVSRKAHGQHHRLPFDGNYCIVSGLWNNALDKNGIFRDWEAAIYEKTKVEPRCWNEPDYKWVKGSASKYD